MNRAQARLALSVTGLFATLLSYDALACGGTFCDSGPAATPVDQTGETVLFVLDGNTVEAHVQIQYVGGATRFAWIVPMPKIPVVSVGSQPLFNALLAGSVPSYGTLRTFDQCYDYGAGNGSAGAGTAGTGGLSTGSGGAAGGGGGGPTVVYDKVVGSFQVVVLQGGTAQEVADWLQTNGYQTVSSASALLQPYVDKSFVFAAIKLTASADVTEIHPLVFKYAGNEPCVPLQLTAVAAQPDMGVRTFFLGDDRVFPSNYAHVTLNPVRLDWVNSASNYKSAVSRAVDSPGSDGHGFVTEYAGPSNVANANFYSASWNASAFRTTQVADVIDLLVSQGLLYCYYNSCSFSQPLVLPLLEEYLPLPAGSDPNVYACLSCGGDGGACTGCNGVSIDTSKWDANAFADDLQNRVIDPAMHAQQLMQKWGYLTRLYTTISPEEMTLDPTFKAMPEHDYETVSMANTLGTWRTTCCGQQVMTVPASSSIQAREVALSASGTWPPFSSLMPWAERIEQVPLIGDLMTLTDNGQAIDDELTRWNTTRSWPPPAGSSNCVVGVAGGPGSGGAAGHSGSVSTGGSSVGVSGSAGLTPGGGNGCSCSLPGSGNTFGFVGALGLLGLGLLRRRRS